MSTDDTRGSSILYSTILIRAIKMLGILLVGTWALVAAWFLVTSPERLESAYTGILEISSLVEAFVVALACGVVGWVTNWIAIYFLFHPREETRWLLGLRKQFGVFPRQKKNIAESVGNMLHSRLLTEDRLRQYLQSPELSQKVRDFVREGLVGILRPKKPHPSLRKILRAEFGLTHEVYAQRERLLANGLEVVATWLEDPERRADIENFVVRALDGLRDRTLQDVFGDQGLAHVSTAGERLIAESLARADEYLEVLLAHIPKNRSLREWIGPGGVNAIYQAIDGLGSVILRHAARMLDDPEVFEAIVDALRRMIRKFIEEKRREGWGARFKLWLADWFVGIEEKIRDLDKHLEPRLAEVKREIQKPEVQLFVLKKLRDLLDTLLDQRPGAFLDRMPAHARREIREALVSFLRSDEVHDALSDLWRRWLRALSREKLDPWLPRVDARALRVRTLLRQLEKTRDHETQVWRCRQALVAAIEDVAATAPEIGLRLRYLRRILTDEAFTVVVRCEHETWRKWLRSQPEGLPDDLAAIEYIPGKTLPEYGDGFEVGGAGGARERHGSLAAFSSCTERIQVVFEGACPYVPMDLRAACELRVVVGSDSDDAPRRQVRDRYGLVREVVVGDIADLPQEVAIAIASWDRTRELEAVVNRLAELLKSITIIPDSQVIESLEEVIGVCCKVIRAEPLGPVPGIDLGAVGHIVASIQSFLAGERSRAMLSAVMREVLDRVMDIPIGFPTERIGEGTVRWIEEKVPSWVLGLVQRHAHRLAGALDFRDTARRAIEETDVADVENLIKSELAGPAFLWLEALGGALGFVIGILLYFVLPVLRAGINVVATG